MHFAVSRQEQFSFLRLSNGGWDSKVDIIFNKMLELNTINDENIKFFNALDKKLSINKYRQSVLHKMGRNCTELKI
jgi:hypothetical protein